MQLDTKPWYKQLWPWILIAIPVVTAIKAVHTIVVMQQHSPDLVVDDYYKAGRAINMQLAKYREAALRAVAVVLGSTDEAELFLDAMQ